jgi:hypothetical protein
MLAATSLAAVIAGCGSGETKTVTNTKTVTTPTATDETAAETTAPDKNSCDAKGINPEKRREGTCVDPDGQKYKTVNRGSTLRLKELNVRVVSTRLTPTLTADTGTERASGQFYVVTLAVTNKLDSPTSFDDGQNQVGLTVGGKTYSEDFEAENMPGNSFVWGSDEIQPEESRTGSVIFDLPNRAVKKLGNSSAAANLIILNFSDIESDPPDLVGTIRLYG